MVKIRNFHPQGGGGPSCLSLPAPLHTNTLITGLSSQNLVHDRTYKKGICSFTVLPITSWIIEQHLNDVNTVTVAVCVWGSKRMHNRYMFYYPHDCYAYSFAPMRRLITVHNPWSPFTTLDHRSQPLFIFHNPWSYFTTLGFVQTRTQCNMVSMGFVIRALNETLTYE